jgi:hypothetical protein
MKNNILLILPLIFFIGCNNSYVTFIVKAPNNTAKITIAGNHSQLGDWNPQTVELNKIDNGKFIRTLYIPNGELEYKITRGSWDTEALNIEGNIPNNHKIIVANDTTIVHVFHEWRDNNTPKSKITGNAIYHRDFYSPQLNNMRDVIVWLPPSYNTQTSKRYPVLYLHDGQNVFDPSTSYLGMDWQLDETVTKLINGGY